MAAQRGNNDKQPVLRAWYLLRVSTQRQMHTATDIDPEGNSVPTQRKHCDAKRKELRAVTHERAAQFMIAELTTT